MTERREVAAAALTQNGRLLIAQRTYPPELAGLWELPGGKVDEGETPETALSRELEEELGILCSVGSRLGSEVLLDHRYVLRAYRVVLLDGCPAAHEHSAIRWIELDELDAIDWVAHDREWLPDLAELLREELTRSE
ncbi:(deoxy)nucleoside triphosphate pyrophosphohydrolase [Hoyosella rhizosphaerae]|uniref:8-oxo-dGTP diphosphatase n=1 Tax=Hoyosella rhizosphaerae TaxID=1755582 RepID=A0A916UDV5_9ACTN|nr:(deoxy)nucleoside triphosphate pyrophosphohydrolase [Hoyosella rhizosphaerae]MBN4925626.1 (deoxy)nucleoside triphosphate pyrophosphohydrolase [Hoyosella rhizosphaerae]GGC69164.1 DNA mismatch repair protein MutT [Hoyosella rhizosphaerae]